jgi:hydrogenase nickel incorporation protein HypA/HybF
MHEYSLIQSLLLRVEEEAQARHATAVRKIRVRLGELAGVDRDLFATAYNTFREAGICRGAELDLIDVPARYECPKCGAPFARGEVLRCVSCEMPASLVEGDDLILDRIEMEIPE